MNSRNYISWPYAAPCLSGLLLLAMPIHAQDAVTYDYSKPSSELVLPQILKEASGLSMGEEGVLYAVEDENGVLYSLDASTGKILNRKLFASDGDYEGVELISGIAHVLRSSGHLYFTDPHAKSRNTRKRLRLDLPGTCDAEAIGYDNANERILVGCKVGDGIRGRKGRSVFAFDEAGARISEFPAVFIDRTLLRSACGECDISIGRFQPSAIAVQPSTGDLFILSAVGENLLIMSSQHNTLIRLDIKHMPQPEGIAFDGENRLYILTEGRSKKARLFRFDPLEASPESDR